MLHFPSAFNSFLVLPPCSRRSSAVSPLAESNGVRPILSLAFKSVPERCAVWRLQCFLSSDDKHSYDWFQRFCQSTHSFGLGHEATSSAHLCCLVVLECLPKCLPSDLALARPSSHRWKISLRSNSPMLASNCQSNSLQGDESEVSIAQSRLTRPAPVSLISSVSLWSRSLIWLSGHSWWSLSHHPSAVLWSCSAVLACPYFCH